MILILMLLALQVVNALLNVAGQGGLEELAMQYSERNHARLVRILTEHERRFLFEYGRLPTSEVELRNTDGYEGLNGVSKPNIKRTAIKDVPGSIIGFNRTIITSPYRYFNGTHEQLIDQNNCGADRGSANYCLNEFAYWAVIEDRELVLSARKELAQQAASIFEKIARANHNGSVPVERADGSPIAEGETIMLANAVGYSGSADDCTGVFAWYGVALTCRDIFDVYGKDIAYTYLGSNGYAIAVTLDPLVASGTEKHIVKVGFL